MTAPHTPLMYVVGRRSKKKQQNNIDGMIYKNIFVHKKFHWNIIIFDSLSVIIRLIIIYFLLNIQSVKTKIRVYFFFFFLPHEFSFLWYFLIWIWVKIILAFYRQTQIYKTTFKYRKKMFEYDWSDKLNIYVWHYSYIQKTIRSA